MKGRVEIGESFLITDEETGQVSIGVARFVPVDSDGKRAVVETDSSGEGGVMGKCTECAWLTDPTVLISRMHCAAESYRGEYSSGADGACVVLPPEQRNPDGQCKAYRERIGLRGLAWDIDGTPLRTPLTAEQIASIEAAAREMGARAAAIQAGVSPYAAGVEATIMSDGAVKEAKGLTSEEIAPEDPDGVYKPYPEAEEACVVCGEPLGQSEKDPTVDYANLHGEVDPLFPDGGIHASCFYGGDRSRSRMWQRVREVDGSLANNNRSIGKLRQAMRDSDDRATLIEERIANLVGEGDRSLKREQSKAVLITELTESVGRVLTTTSMTAGRINKQEDLVDDLSESVLKLAELVEKGGKETNESVGRVLERTSTVDGRIGKLAVVVEEASEAFEKGEKETSEALGRLLARMCAIDRRIEKLEERVPDQNVDDGK